MERNLELSQDNITASDQPGENVMEAVPDYIQDVDEEKNPFPRDNTEMVVEFVPGTEHEAKDNIQHHTPEADQERGDAHLIAAGTDDGVDPIQAEDNPQVNFIQQFVYNHDRQPKKKDIVY